MKSSHFNELGIVSQLTTLAGAVVLVSPGLGAHSSVIAGSRITGVIDSVTILPCPSSVTVTPEEKYFTIHISRVSDRIYYRLLLSLETYNREIVLKQRQEIPSHDHFLRHGQGWGTILADRCGK